MKVAKIIVAGGRDFDNYEYMEECLDNFLFDEIKAKHGPDKIELICGMAVGADFLAIKYAIKHNIDIVPFEPKFWQYGERAGEVRNHDMASYASESDIPYLVSFWDGKSRGTKNMIDRSTTYGIPYMIFKYEKNDVEV